MAFLDRMERRFGWLAFPGFLRYYALFHVMVYVLQMFNPGIGRALNFDRNLIMAGEVWRLITFLFASSGNTGFSPLGILFLFFMVMIAFMMSDSLEGAWGVFRTSMFYYAGIVGLIIGNFFLPVDAPWSGFLLYQSAFFAFATLFPNVEFRLFLILPIQVRYLAILLAVLTVAPIFGSLAWLPFLMLALGNYVLWAGIPALKGGVRLAGAAKRRRRFNSSKLPEDEAFHRCKTCGKTDVSDPSLEFRVGPDGEEYCENHLLQAPSGRATSREP